MPVEEDAGLPPPFIPHAPVPPPPVTARAATAAAVDVRPADVAQVAPATKPALSEVAVESAAALMVVVLNEQAVVERVALLNERRPVHVGARHGDSPGAPTRLARGYRLQRTEITASVMNCQLSLSQVGALRASTGRARHFSQATPSPSRSRPDR